MKTAKTAIGTNYALQKACSYEISPDLQLLIPNFLENLILGV